MNTPIADILLKIGVTLFALGVATCCVAGIFAAFE